MEVDGEESITYRATLWIRMFVLVLGAGCAVVGVIVGLDPVAAGSERVGGWFLAAFGLWLAVRAPRVALHADRDRLLIRGWFTSRRIRWDQVRTVSPGMSSMVSKSPTQAYTLVVERSDGRSLPVDCLAGMAEEELDERAAALRQLGGLDPLITTAARPSGWRWTIYFALLILVPVAFAIAMSSDRDERRDRSERFRECIAESDDDLECMELP